MSIKTIYTKNAPEAVGPYSQGVVLENLIFTSGQLPVDMSTGELVKNDIKRETSLCLQNLNAVLNEEGTSLDKAIKLTIFITDMNDFPQINEAYAEFFQEHKPARSCVQVSRLPKDARIEIEAIVAK